MKVLVVGGGGREHALAWRISQSPQLTELFCAPGNPGTARIARNLPVKADDPAAVVALAKQHAIDLVVVGPEAPLVAGVADALSAAGVLVFGPSQAAARIEGSKAFAKEIMQQAGIPTAHTAVFEDPQAAEAYVRAHPQIVVKADGLAAGKGVVVARSEAEAVAAVRELSATSAGKRLVLEELLEGEEVSAIALCDGERYAMLPPAQDHKRVGDGDQGPNTGGMGAYAPTRAISAEELDEVGRTVIGPCLATMAARGIPFKGALFAGLMLTGRGIRVLEFNCRFGDPETQVLMMQLAEDVLPLLHACAAGTLRARKLVVRGGASVGVVLAAHGYPQAPRAGDAISLPESLNDAQVFHAGTQLEGSTLRTSGGRVLTVCAHGSDFQQARERAYAAVSQIHFPGMHFRKDIGARELSRGG